MIIFEIIGPSVQYAVYKFSMRAVIPALLVKRRRHFETRGCEHLFSDKTTHISNY